jgi:hypothetical protein
LIDQYGNDPKNITEIRRAALEFIRDKIGNASSETREELTLNFGFEVSNRYIYYDESPNNTKEAFYKSVMDDIRDCLRGFYRSDKTKIGNLIEDIRKLLMHERQIQRQQQRELMEEQLLVDMYGWRLTVWRWLKSQCACSHPQEQGHEPQRTQGQ